MTKGEKKTSVLDQEEVRPDAGLKTVKLFNCEVRLSGDIMLTHYKFGVTKGEIRVLRAIHGDSGVVNVTDAGEKEVNEMEELYALAVKYSKDIDPRPGIRLIERLFNVTLDGFNEWNELQFDKQEASRRARQEKTQAIATRMMQARALADARVQAQVATEAAGDAA